MAGCQPFKLSSRGAQPLTPWMRIHCRISAIQIKLRRGTVTHNLNGNSWQDVSYSNGAQDMHSHSLPGWEFMAGCQPFKLSSGGAQPLTAWMGIHDRMSAIQIELRRCTATHKLDGNSWQNVSHSN